MKVPNYNSFLDKLSKENNIISSILFADVISFENKNCILLFVLRYNIKFKDLYFDVFMLEVDNLKEINHKSFKSYNQAIEYYEINTSKTTLKYNTSIFAELLNL